MSTLRIARAEDAEGIAAIYAPIVRDTPISFEVDPPSPDEMRRRVHTNLATHPGSCAPRARTCAATRTPRAIATARPTACPWTSPPTCTRQHADAASAPRCTRRWCRCWCARATGAPMGITLPNLASVALHESAGLEPIAVYVGVGWKLGAWHDVGWWARTLAPSNGEPAKPEAFSALRGDDAVRAALAEATRRLAPA